MKKSIFILAATTLLIGCASNEIKNDLEGNDAPINFTKTYIEKGTKAFQYGAYDMSNFKTEGNTFAVFGFKTVAGKQSQVFGERQGEDEGVVVTYGTDWTYSPLRYWDKTATKYDFYAYAPSSDKFTGTVALSSNSANAFSITGFKQGTTQAQLIDLMTDLTSKQGDNSVTQSSTKKIGQNDVEFTFSHILSNINVLMAISPELKSDSVLNPVMIDSVEISSIKMDGDYSYVTNAYKWTLAGNSTEATFKATIGDSVVFDPNVLKANTATYSGGTLPAASVGIQDVPGLTDLLFVPQALAENDYKIWIKYHIANQVYYSTVYLSDFKKENNSLETWVPGYKYNYVLIIGPTPVLFDVADINDWGEGGTYTYTIE